MLNDELIYAVLCAVAEIPCGRVASYGQIARLIGRDKNARLVGRVLRHASLYGSYPCHRVGKPHRAHRARLARPAPPAGGRGRNLSPQRLCGHEALPVELLTASR